MDALIRTLARVAGLRRPPGKAPAPMAAAANTRRLADMCHEIRNPLNAVLGFTQLMALDAEHLSDKHRRNLQAIDQAARHILAVVDESLSAARGQGGAARNHDAAVAVERVIDDVMCWMQPAATAAGVRLTASPLPARVRGNAQHIHEVLINLVSNAIKYIRRGGEVRVNVVHEPAALQVVIEVHDTGRGMTPAMQARLFSRFDRLGAERHGVEGTGIGLCITRRLVECMGGGIEMSSQPGAGSRFSVRLHAA
jgi:signal transduction histidine kinase